MPALLIAIALLVQAVAGPVAAFPRPSVEAGVSASGPMLVSKERSRALACDVAQEETDASGTLAGPPAPGPWPATASPSRLFEGPIGSSAGAERLDRPPKHG